jgi:hypothetical protein
VTGLPLRAAEVAEAIEALIDQGGLEQ